MVPTIRFVDILWLVLGATVAAVFVALVVNAAFPAIALMASGLTSSAWILLGYGGVIGDRRWEPLSARFAPVGGRVLWGSAAAGVGLLLLFSFLTQLLSAAGADLQPLAPSPVLPNDIAQLPLALVVVAVLGPTAEEVLFRGLLLDWLRARVQPSVAVAAISVLFALLHDNGLRTGLTGLMAFTTRLILGIVTSVLVLRYRSLRPSAVLHGSFNGFVCVAHAMQW
jgi:membrane protease YdiL (CAAX protease family)